MSTGVGFLEVRIEMFGLGMLGDGLWLLAYLFAVEGDVVIKVVIDLDSSHELPRIIIFNELL